MLSCCLGTSFWYPTSFRSKDTLKECSLKLSSSEEVVSSFQCLKLSRKGNTKSYVSSICGLTSFFFLFFLQRVNPGFICHTWKEGIFRRSSQVLQLSPQLPMWFLQLMDSGHVTNSIAMAGNAAPTSLKMLRCLRSPSSSSSTVKKSLCDSLQGEQSARNQQAGTSSSYSSHKLHNEKLTGGEAENWEYSLRAKSLSAQRWQIYISELWQRTISPPLPHALQKNRVVEAFEMTWFQTSKSPRIYSQWEEGALSREIEPSWLWTHLRPAL